MNSGLCNSTTLRILKINHMVLLFQITIWLQIGNIGLIPRIDIISSVLTFHNEKNTISIKAMLCNDN